MTTPRSGFDMTVIPLVTFFDASLMSHIWLFPRNGPWRSIAARSIHADSERCVVPFLHRSVGSKDNHCRTLALGRHSVFWRLSTRTCPSRTSRRTEHRNPHYRWVGILHSADVVAQTYPKIFLTRQRPFVRDCVAFCWVLFG